MHRIHTALLTLDIWIWFQALDEWMNAECDNVTTWSHIYLTTLTSSDLYVVCCALSIFLPLDSGRVLGQVALYFALIASLSTPSSLPPFPSSPICLPLPSWVALHRKSSGLAYRFWQFHHMKRSCCTGKLIASVLVGIPTRPGVLGLLPFRIHWSLSLRHLVLAQFQAIRNACHLNICNHLSLEVDPECRIACIFRDSLDQPQENMIKACGTNGTIQFGDLVSVVPGRKLCCWWCKLVAMLHRRRREPSWAPGH